MRDRGKQKVPPPKKMRTGMSRKAQKIQQMEKPRQLQKQVKVRNLHVRFLLLYKCIVVIKVKGRVARLQVVEGSSLNARKAVLYA